MTCIKSFSIFGLPQTLSSPASTHHRLSNQHHTYVHVPIQTDHPPRPQLQNIVPLLLSKLTYIVIIFYNKYFPLIKWCRWKFHFPFLRRYFSCKNSRMMYFLLFQQHIMGNQEIFFLINRNISRQTDCKYRPTTFISVYTIVPLCTHTSSCVKCRPTPTLLPENYFA